LIKPPKDLACAYFAPLDQCPLFEGFVDRFRLNQAVGLLPKPDLGSVPEKPPIADDSMFRGELAC
jgi:hypothetical protein